MRSKPAIHGTFQAGILYAINDSNKLMLGVYSDFDVIKAQITEMLECKPASLTSIVSPEFTMLPEDSKTWPVRSEKNYNKIFEAFFRHYKKPSEVRNKPAIEKLLLIPFNIDHPLVPNDFLES